MGTILLVLWVMTMFLWLLAMLGAVKENYSPWLGWFACLFLGLAIFLRGVPGLQLTLVLSVLALGLS